MALSKILRAALGTSIGFAVAAWTIPSAAAQGNSTLGVRNVVLVHGAWADGSSWSKVIPRLEQHGLNVVAVQLPMTSVADDVATTERALALQNGPVLLAGHSYGGVVITEAGSDAKVAGLLYVAAYAPDEGQSAMTLAYANPTPIDAEITADSSGFLKLTPKGIAEDFAPDLSDVEKRNLTATQGPWAFVAFSTPVTAPAWKNKPTWFVIAVNDRVISHQLEETEAFNMHARTLTLPTSHVAMLAEPEKVAQFIFEAAELAGRK